MYLPALDDERTTLRNYLENQLNGHAGHADMLREQIDGAKAAELHAAVEGLEENDYVKPWRPAGS